MVLGKLTVPGRPTISIIVGQGPVALAAGGGGLDIFTLIYSFSSFSLSLAQWIKRWPTDLADQVRSPLEAKSSQP